MYVTFGRTLPSWIFAHHPLLPPKIFNPFVHFCVVHKKLIPYICASACAPAPPPLKKKYEKWENFLSILGLNFILVAGTISFYESGKFYD